MFRLLICLALFASFCAASAAKDLTTPKRPVKQTTTPAKNDDNKIKEFYVNAGIHTEFYKEVQTNSSGSLRQLDTAPTVGLGLVVPLDQDFLFLSELNWVLPQKPAERIIKNTVMLRADLGYSPVEWFRLRAGTSLMWLNQHSSGGSTQINNGNSTSTFYYPAGNESSFNNTLDLGAELLVDSWALRFQTYTYSVFKEEQRNLSYSLFVSYYWDR